MWVVRLTQKKRHWRTDRSAAKPADVQALAQELQPRTDPFEEGLSVYLVEDPDDEARKAALYHRAGSGGGPKVTQYVVLPDEVFEDLDVVPRPMPDRLPTWLSERHHEILGLHDAATRQRLAATILASDARRIEQIPKGEGRRIVTKLATEDGELSGRIDDRWRIG